MSDREKHKDTAFFPAPRAKGSYREPAERVLVAVGQEREEDRDAPKPAPKVIANRPVSVEEDGDKTAPARPMIPSSLELRAAIHDERVYWFRNSFLAQNPRLAGGIATVLGGALSVAALSMVHDGFRSSRGLMLGPVLLFFGIFPLIFGYPVDEKFRAPSWWVKAYVVTVVVGCVISVAVFVAVS